MNLTENLFGYPLPLSYSLGFCTVIAILEGFLEQNTMRSGFTTHGTTFGPFYISYHFPLFIKWLLICTFAGVWWFLPLFGIIQDYSWYKFNPNQTLRSTSWTNYVLGGFYLWGDPRKKGLPEIEKYLRNSAWIPYIYPTFILTSGILFLIDRYIIK